MRWHKKLVLALAVEMEILWKKNGNFHSNRLEWKK